MKTTKGEDITLHTEDIPAQRPESPPAGILLTFKVNGEFLGQYRIGRFSLKDDRLIFIPYRIVNEDYISTNKNGEIEVL